MYMYMYMYMYMFMFMYMYMYMYMFRTCYVVLSCIKHDQTCAAVQEDAKVLEKETDNMKATEAGEIDSQLAISL